MSFAYPSKKCSVFRLLAYLVVGVACLIAVFIFCLHFSDPGRAEAVVVRSVTDNATKELCHRWCKLARKEGALDLTAVDSVISRVPGSPHDHHLLTGLLLGLPAGLEPSGGWAPESSTLASSTFASSTPASSTPVCPDSAQHPVAIVFPYRNRMAQLTGVLGRLVPMLRQQGLCFVIFVVEQAGQTDLPFNKGRLINAGFLEAERRFPLACFIVHDTDLVPLHPDQPYSCQSAGQADSLVVEHLGVRTHNARFQLPYPTLIGGVLKFSRLAFQRVNGFSNEYWGWGLEDDDMELRLREASLQLRRPYWATSIYFHQQHDRQMIFSNNGSMRQKLLGSARNRMLKDGLNNLNYTLIGVHETWLYTHLLLDVGRPP